MGAASANVVPYNPKDRTHRQIHPDAYALITKHGGVILPGIRDDKSPNFRGLTDEWWQKFYDTAPQDFMRVMVICRRDFPTACALLLKIVSRLDMQRTPFIWNSGQQACWNKMVWCLASSRMIFLIILKARQMGITCFVAAFHFWNLWRGTNVRTLDTTHDEPLAARVIAFFSVFYESMPTVYDRMAQTGAKLGVPLRVLRPPLRSESKTAKIPKKELYFSDRMCLGSTYVAKNLDPRGFTSPHIGLHEAAFYPNLNDFYSALEPQLPALGTKARLSCSIIFESTPNGQDDFYEFWEATKEQDSEMVGVFLPWYIHDDEYTVEPPDGWRMSAEEKDLQVRLSLQREKIDGKRVTRAQMYWRHCKLKNLKGDDDAFDMEYPSDDQSCFLMKSESVFSDDMKYLTASVLNADVRAQEAWGKLSDSNGDPIEAKGALTGNLKFAPLHSPFETVYHIKINRPKFAIGNGDLWVWEPPEKNKIYFCGADTAGGELGRDLSTAFVLDITTGKQVAEFAGHLQPEAYADYLVHLCRWYNDMMILPEINGLGSVVMKRMTNDWGYTNVAHEEKWDEVGVKKNKPGFETNPRNRPLIFSTLKWFVQERYIQVASRDLVREMSTFKKDGMDYRTAKKHQHDDRVVAAGLCCIGIRQAPKYMMMVEEGRRSRIPSAVDLGLSHQPDINPEHERIRAQMDDALYDKLFMKDTSWEFPANPIRGYLDF